MSIVALHFKPCQRHARACGSGHHAAIFALAALAAGCAHYQAAPLEPRRSAAQFAARELSDAQLGTAVNGLLPQALPEWPPPTWDRAELLAAALVQNPELAVARSEIQAVQAREISAAQPPNPDLTLQSEYARHDGPSWLYGISLDWLLRSGDRRRLDIALARAETGNAKLKLMDQIWNVRRALASALTDAERARRRLTLLERLGAAQDRLLALEQQRIKGGEDSPNEIVASQRARIEIEQQVAEERVSAGASQAAAAKALGVPPQALDGVAMSWPDWGEPPAVDAEGLQSRKEMALLSRADLGVAMGEYAAAETRLRLAVARQYPELALEPGYYWDHGIAKFPFDVGFTLPLNRNRGEIAEARAERDVAGQRMLALQADIYGEIAAAERAEQTARGSVDAAERQLKAARLQERQADLGVHLGAADIIEQTGATILTTRAELELLQMRALLQESRNELEDALHMPLSGPEIGLALPLSADASAGGG